MPYLSTKLIFFSIYNIMGNSGSNAKKGEGYTKEEMQKIVERMTASSNRNLRKKSADASSKAYTTRRRQEHGHKKTGGRRKMRKSRKRKSRKFRRSRKYKKIRV